MAGRDVSEGNILIVDDEPGIVRLIAMYLEREGFQTSSARTGAEALAAVRSSDPSLVVLDIMLPDIDGWEVCREIRAVSDVPIVMLTARESDEDKIVGLELGADDYVTKPFSPKQLAMRIRAVMRRSSGKTTSEPVSVLHVGQYTLDMESHQVSRGDVVAQLTPLEFRILYMLAMNEGRVVSFGRLVEYAWGYDGGEPSMLKTHISHIRKKLNVKEGEPGYISVVHGVGYILQRS